MLSLLRPDLGKIIYLVLGVVVVPKIIRKVRP
jgi:hypothetical protein